VSPEAQRIAIAEACGWTKHPRESRECYDPTGLLCYWSDAPDYLNDLNAMHEAFREIRKRGLVQEYGDELASVTTVDRGAYFAHATAAQRAEAFLRTIGKWQAPGLVEGNDNAR
jgi:hypothetical protein